MSEFKVGDTIMLKGGNRQVYHIVEVLYDDEEFVFYMIKDYLSSNQSRMIREGSAISYPDFQTWIDLIAY